MHRALILGMLVLMIATAPAASAGGDELVCVPDDLPVSGACVMYPQSAILEMIRECLPDQDPYQPTVCGP